MKDLVSCEHVIHTLDACQRDLRWTVIATYSPTTPPAVHAIATGSCPMMPSVVPDRREPVPTASGFAVTRRGRPGMLTATGAGREEGCGGRAFGGAVAAPRAPHCVRIINHHQKDEPAPPSAHAGVVR